MLPERSCIMSILSFCFALEEKAAAKGKKEREREREKREGDMQKERDKQRANQRDRERERETGRRKPTNNLFLFPSCRLPGCPA